MLVVPLVDGLVVDGVVLKKKELKLKLKFSL